MPLPEANRAAKNRTVAGSRNSPEPNGANRTVAGCDPILADRFPAKIPSGFGGRTRPRFLCRAHIFSWQIRRTACQPP